MLTGFNLWSYTTGDVDSSPAVAGGVVYVGSEDGKVYALNSVSGGQLWNFTTGGSVVSSPTVVGDVVYVGSSDDKVYAISSPEHLGIPATYILVVVVTIAVVVATALGLKNDDKRESKIAHSHSFETL